MIKVEYCFNCRQCTNVEESNVPYKGTDCCISTKRCTICNTTISCKINKNVKRLIYKYSELFRKVSKGYD